MIWRESLVTKKGGGEEEMVKNMQHKQQVQKL